jgi:hypothetical protein
MSDTANLFELSTKYMLPVYSSWLVSSDFCLVISSALWSVGYMQLLFFFDFFCVETCPTWNDAPVQHFQRVCISFTLNLWSKVTSEKTAKWVWHCRLLYICKLWPVIPDLEGNVREERRDLAHIQDIYISGQITIPINNHRNKQKSTKNKTRRSMIYQPQWVHKCITISHIKELHIHEF